MYNSLLSQQCFADGDNVEPYSGDFALQNLSTMDVTGTSELTTAPISKSAIMKHKSDKDRARISEDGEDMKSLRHHKRILKFNKKYR